MNLMLIAGARPNFMKIASIVDAIKTHNLSTNKSINHILVHTGQHYDDSMSEAFFRDLDLPKPDIYLEVGSGSHAAQTAEIMKRFEPVLLEYQPDVVVLVGDVNSTVACALVTSKIEYSTPNSELRTQNSRRRPWIAHIEAGLRSFDRTMPEEINRILTDHLSDFLFVSEKSGIENLKKEGFINFIDEEQINNHSLLTIHNSLPLVAYVGNTMIDTLLKHKQIAQKSNILNKLSLSTINQKLSTSNQKPATSNQVVPYAVLTLHRPSNVDDQETFKDILDALTEVSKHIPIIFPAHPRTVNRIKEFGFEKYFIFLSNDQKRATSNQQPESSIHQPATINFCIHCLEPLGYLDFLCLMSNAKLVLTDSGGIQEETTILGIPCITLRENTERPITEIYGTNVLAGIQKEGIISSALSQLKKYNIGRSNNPKSEIRNLKFKVPPLWDGKAGQRIIQILVSSLWSKDQELKTIEHRPATIN